MEKINSPEDHESRTSKAVHGLVETELHLRRCLLSFEPVTKQRQLARYWYLLPHTHTWNTLVHGWYLIPGTRWLKVQMDSSSESSKGVGDYIVFYF